MYIELNNRPNNNLNNSINNSVNHNLNDSINNSMNHNPDHNLFNDSELNLSPASNNNMYSTLQASIETLTLYRPAPGDILYDLPAGQPLCARVSELVSLSQKLKLSGNLWQNYLTYFLITHENPFTMSRERAADRQDGLRMLALRDAAVFRVLFHWNGENTSGARLNKDTAENKESLFSILCSFPCDGTENEELTALVRSLAEAPDDEAFLKILTDWYERKGVGEFGLYRSFRVETGINGAPRLRPLKGGTQTLDDLIGYEIQKNQLRQNTLALLSGKPAANVLLYGDAGTGKSSAVRALLNEWPDSSLRLVELTKAQLSSLSSVSTLCGQRNYKFILFIDDLSFEEHEVEYKQLKAAMEGSAEECPDNLRIYATSNRRHLLRENWSDRSDMEHDGDVHRSDTLEEKLSLAGRFGLAISYSSPNPTLYRQIVRSLAEEAGVTLEETELLKLADTFSIRKGGMTGRAARQFVDSLLCK